MADQLINGSNFEATYSYPDECLTIKGQYVASERIENARLVYEEISDSTELGVFSVLGSPGTATQFGDDLDTFALQPVKVPLETPTDLAKILVQLSVKVTREGRICLPEDDFQKWLQKAIAYVDKNYPKTDNRLLEVVGVRSPIKNPKSKSPYSVTYAAAFQLTNDPVDSSDIDQMIVVDGGCLTANRQTYELSGGAPLNVMPGLKDFEASDCDLGGIVDEYLPYDGTNYSKFAYAKFTLTQPKTLPDGIPDQYYFDFFQADGTRILSVGADGVKYFPKEASATPVARYRSSLVNGSDGSNGSKPLRRAILAE